MQFPGESAPADIYGGEWTNISSQFAGQFFRAEGGNAAVFGGTQGDGAPEVTGYANNIACGGDASSDTSGALYRPSESNNNKATSTNPYGWKIQLALSLSRGNAVYGAANEVRPANSTIRIWRKTA